MSTIQELYMKQLIDNLKEKISNDDERDHIIMDKFMFDLLRKLGYSELVDFIEQRTRWYA